MTDLCLPVMVVTTYFHTPCMYLSNDEKNPLGDIRTYPFWHRSTVKGCCRSGRSSRRLSRRLPLINFTSPCRGLPLRPVFVLLICLRSLARITFLSVEPGKHVLADRISIAPLVSAIVPPLSPASRRSRFLWFVLTNGSYNWTIWRLEWIWPWTRENYGGRLDWILWSLCWMLLLTLTVWTRSSSRPNCVNYGHSSSVCFWSN